MAPNYPVPEEFDDPRLRRLFDYWFGKFRDGRLPSRTDIDLTEIPDLLGHINIIEVERDGGRLRFRYTLWGTAVTELFGRDYTGHYLDDIVIPTQAPVAGVLLAV